MREFCKFLLSGLLVLGIVFIIDYLFGIVLENHAVFVDQPKYSRIKNSSDSLVILGASRADNQYVTAIFEEKLGMPSYNYGVGAQNVYTNYAILNLLLTKAHTSPKYVVWDFYYTDILDSPGWNTEKLDRLYSAYEYDKAVKEVIDLQGKKKRILLNHLKLYKFNSKVLRLLKRQKEDITGGYSARYISTCDNLEYYSSDRTTIDQQKLLYVDRFIQLCKDNDIKLFVLISPGYYILGDKGKNDWATIIENKCEEKDIPFYDFEQDSVFLSHPEWFYNTIHLNDMGAKEYTKKVVNVISNYLEHNK